VSTAGETKIFHLAVLRAAMERCHLGKYFGSYAALKFWIESARIGGLIDADDAPTELGRDLAAALELSAQSPGRAYLWRGWDSLEARAHAFLASHQGGQSGHPDGRA